jgi:hypothetical protein
MNDASITKKTTAIKKTSRKIPPPLDTEEINEIIHVTADDVRATYVDGIKTELRNGMAFLTFTQNLPSGMNQPGGLKAMALCRVVMTEELLRDYLNQRDNILDAASDS